MILQTNVVRNERIMNLRQAGKCLELVAIAHCDTATCSIYAPTDSAIEAVTDIFEIDKHFVMIINLICTTNANQSVAGD